MRPRVLLTAFALLAPVAAQAHDIDRIEHLFGATHVTAQSGNGGLSVGVAPTGEVTVLSWPSPTFYDQLDYQTSADEDAREQPFFGADADQGMFAGLWIEVDGGEPELIWLRDARFEVQQSYLTEVSAAVVTLSRSEELGLAVVETLFVDLEQDALHRRAVIKRDADSPVTAASYVLYEDLAPATSKPDDLATSSLFGQDDDHDFVAWYDPDLGAVLHGAPTGGRDLALLDELMAGDWSVDGAWSASGLPAMRELADAVLDGGVVLALGGATAPDAVQVGFQSSRPCGDAVAGWTWTPEGAFADAADGALGGSPVAGCHANAALLWDLDLGEPGTLAEVTVDVALVAASSELDAGEELGYALDLGFDGALGRTDTAWSERALSWNVPDGLDDEVIHFSRRALIAILQGTDRDVTATVASLAVQPSYHHDWPRDSVFFDLALDLAGEHELVSRHQAFLASVQNTEAVVDPELGVLRSPPGAWFMNYYSDGSPSTTSLNTFEIDQVGLTLWSFWAHAAAAPNDGARRDSLAAVWPAIRRGATLLATCVDDDHPAVAGTTPPDGFPAWWPVFEALGDGTIPDAAARRAAMESGDWESLRPCRANEDDNPLHTVSVYSTTTTRMGLLAAAQAAELLCVDDDPEVTYWRERADELGAVALSLYYDEGTGDWEGDRPDWILWPIPMSIDPSLDDLFSDASTEGQRRADVEALQAAALDAFAGRIHDEVDDAVNLRTEGAAYQNKKTLMLARYWAVLGEPDPGQVDANGEHVRQMAVDLPLGTRHVGEVWASIDDDGDGIYDRADQRVSVPHLWAATLTYLSAMALAHPELFEGLESTDVPRVCTQGVEPTEYRDAKGCDENCQESVVGGGRGAGGLAIALVLIGAATRTRRRRAAG